MLLSREQETVKDSGMQVIILNGSIFIKNLVSDIVQRARDMPLLLRRMLWELMDPQRAIPLVHRTRILFFVSVFSLLPKS